MTSYDAIVIGAGHNGLVCGAYLAKAGRRVVVLEGRERVGGATDTSSPWPELPDCRVSTYSYVVSLMSPAVVADLELERHGYRLVPQGPTVQAYPDGGALVIDSDDPEAAHASIARFSKRDADRYRTPVRGRNEAGGRSGGHAVAGSGAANRPRGHL